MPAPPCTWNATSDPSGPPTSASSSGAQAEFEELVEAVEHRGGIRGSAAEPAADRNPLLELRACTARARPTARSERVVGQHREVLRDRPVDVGRRGASSCQLIAYRLG